MVEWHLLLWVIQQNVYVFYRPLLVLEVHVDHDAVWNCDWITKNAFMLLFHTRSCGGNPLWIELQVFNILLFHLQQPTSTWWGVTQGTCLFRCQPTWTLLLLTVLYVRIHQDDQKNKLGTSAFLFYFLMGPGCLQASSVIFTSSFCRPVPWY